MTTEQIISYKDLIVWQKAMDLVEVVYYKTQNFPSHETYGLTSQMRRASVSIATNISEGYHRNHIKEYIHFLSISKGSAAELETLFDISFRLKYIDSKKEELNSAVVEILKMLNSLINKLKYKNLNIK